MPATRALDAQFEITAFGQLFATMGTTNFLHFEPSRFVIGFAGLSTGGEALVKARRALLRVAMTG
ncbi:hypothetical protein QR66_01795 [Chromobacterium piscinae]|nr:hypothetical protein QR66_01795 [Chromobacterium piscinae]